MWRFVILLCTMMLAYFTCYSQADLHGLIRSARLDLIEGRDHFAREKAEKVLENGVVGKLKADALVIVARVLQNNGNTEQALEVFQQTLNIRRANIAKTPVLVADSYQHIGNCYLEMEQYEQAASHFRQALSIRMKYNSPYNDTLIYLQISMGICSKNDQMQGRRWFDRAIKYARKPETQANAWMAAGNAYLYWGETEQAGVCFDKSLQVLGDENYPDLRANLMLNRGNLHFNNNAFEQARNDYMSAARIWKSTCEAGLRKAAEALQLASYASLQMADSENAFSLLEEAEISYPDNINSIKYAKFLLISAKYLLYAGYPEPVINRCEIALSILPESNVNNKLECLAYGLLGDAFAMIQEDQYAIAYYQMALERANQLYDVEQLITLQLHLAELHLDNGHSSQSLQALNKAQSAFLLLTSSKAPHLELSILKVAAKVSIVQQRYREAIASIERGLQYAAQNKADSFIAVSLLLLRAEALQQLKDDNALAAFQEAENRLSSILKKFGNRSGVELVDLYHGIYEGLIAALLAKGKTTEAFSISDKSHAMFLLGKHGLDQSDLTALQRKLAVRKSALLEYFWGERQVYLFIVTPQKLLCYTLPADSTTESTIIRLYSALSTNPDKIRSTDRLFASFAHDAYLLYTMLLEPYMDELPERLIIVPSGVLSALPFSALLTKKITEPHNLGSYDFLIKHKSISYAPSAAFWMKNKPNKRREGRNYAFLPNFRSDPRNWTALEHSKTEVANLQQYFSFELLENRQATVDAFIEVYPLARFIHLSTHAAVSFGHRDSSYIVFQHRTGRPRELFIRDILQLKSNAEMVVLSACETGIGRIYRGEGPWSLTRAFLETGSASVVNTYWSVDDQSSAIIIKEFYKQLKKGITKDEALRKAQLSLLNNLGKDGYFPYPFYWAAFTIIGDTSPVGLPYNWRLLFEFMVAIVVGVGVIGLIYSRNNKR